MTLTMTSRDAPSIALHLLPASLRSSVLGIGIYEVNRFRRRRVFSFSTEASENLKRSGKCQAEWFLRVSHQDPSLTSRSSQWDMSLLKSFHSNFTAWAWAAWDYNSLRLEKCISTLVWNLLKSPSFTFNSPHAFYLCTFGGFPPSMHEAYLSRLSLRLWTWKCRSSKRTRDISLWIELKFIMTWLDWLILGCIQKDKA